MSKLRVYMSSATKKVNKKFQDWRTLCTSVWGEAGVYTDLQFINPIAYFNYTEKQPKTDKQCLDLFMYQIDHCDVLLCNLDYSNSSIGTGMEVEHAFCKDIPIIAFGEKPDTWYNWIETRATVVFDSLTEAVEYINDYYVMRG